MTQTEFEQTLLRTRDKMIRVAISFFHNKEDAEDVVQEVCMRMLERGWKSGDNTEALLIKATKNLCVSVWRRQKLRQQTSPFTPPLEGTGEAADVLLLQKEQRNQLEQAIERLTPSEQKLIRMKGEELSLDEIAEQTGFSKRTASTMLWQAKKRLLTILKHNTDD
jgi:RNA polymerase sigma factor (sigma-70 family)